MKALTWQGRRDVRVEVVADPRIQEANDAIVKVNPPGGAPLRIAGIASTPAMGSAGLSR